MKLLFLVVFFSVSLFGQDYFTEKYMPFSNEVDSPEKFLGYKIGSQHTRHDRILDYLKYLSTVSSRARIQQYGETHEGKKLILFSVSKIENLKNLEVIQKAHVEYVFGKINDEPDIPIIINLGYNVHGNEPSSSEAALLTAYTLVASEHSKIKKFRENAVIFIDPTINPDGRDRHSQWVNSYKGSPLVSDPMDAEHNEAWPGGRTNHYWFDLNRDWLLAINPESQGKLEWYHKWYPNVVTDFHEMGTQSTYYFEPPKPNGSLNPVVPDELETKLTDIFSAYFSKALDSVGSLYFTKETFDVTYPGYGSSYPNFQGGKGLLFEQASSRGHKQKVNTGFLTFPFTIRNQYISSFATIEASVDNKSVFRQYQHNFFKTAMSKSRSSKIKAYVFNDTDQNKTKSFVDKMLRHKINVYKTGKNSFEIPTEQFQYRMVQSFFETYEKYRDSAFYDASAWSVANFYNIKYEPKNKVSDGIKIKNLSNFIELEAINKSNYAYAINSQDYNIPALIQDIQNVNLVATVAFKPFKSKNNFLFPYGSIIVPVKLQNKTEEEIFNIMKKLQLKHQIQIHGLNTGLSLEGIDLGSRNVKVIKKPKPLMIIGDGIRAYEAGEVWHLLDTRVGIPITKIHSHRLGNIDLENYNTLVLVSGTYSWGEEISEKLNKWVSKGNTIISIGTSNKSLINNGIVNEELVENVKDSVSKIMTIPYVDADQNLGREELGGVFLNGVMDLSHPINFGYNTKTISLFKNNRVWLRPSKSPYGSPVVYARDPHIDGYISNGIRKNFLPYSAPVIVSSNGKGRVVMFAENPNFRGTAYGTNRMFLNAIFLGNHITVPKDPYRINSLPKDL